MPHKRSMHARVRQLLQHRRLHGKKMGHTIVLSVLPINKSPADAKPQNEQKALGKTGSQNTLYRCNGNKWCCSLGGNITSCCDDSFTGDNLFQFPNDLAQIQNGTAFAPGLTIAEIAQSGGNSSINSTTNGTCPAVAATAETPCPASGNSDGDKAMRVGVGVGVGIGVPLLAALMGCLFLLYREKQRARAGFVGSIPVGYDVQDGILGPGHPSEYKGVFSTTAHANSPTELDASKISRELPASPNEVQAPYSR
ncbi:MAG: hypothetical protein Q9190_007591 [Brigantiaea leucoxantha]